MRYYETDFNLCRNCYIKLHNPSKKSLKKMELTEYKDQCENCGRMERLVDFVWEPDEEDE